MRGFTTPTLGWIPEGFQPPPNQTFFLEPVYQRLAELEVDSVRVFAIPALLHHDDEWLAIEMTIVRPPYLLDFVGALLDEPHDFHEETWEVWEMDRMEKFEDR